MRIIIESHDECHETRVETASCKTTPMVFTMRRVPVAVLYNVVGEICPPIIYTPQITTSTGTGVGERHNTEFTFTIAKNSKRLLATRRHQNS